MDKNLDKQVNVDKKQPNTEALKKIDSKYPNHAERNRQSVDERGTDVKEGFDEKYDRNASN